VAYFASQLYYKHTVVTMYIGGTSKSSGSPTILTSLFCLGLAIKLGTYALRSRESANCTKHKGQACHGLEGSKAGHRGKLLAANPWVWNVPSGAILYLMTRQDRRRGSHMITLEEELSQPEFDGFLKTSTSPCGRILKPESLSGGPSCSSETEMQSSDFFLSHGPAAALLTAERL
jgi:hypothetical protein